MIVRFRGRKAIHLRSAAPVSALLLSAVLLTGCGEDAAAPLAEPPAPIRVLVVKPEAQSANRSFTGTIQPRVETLQGFRVGGKILERLVSVGDSVRKDQVLAKLDQTDLALQQQSAEAEVNAAETSLKSAGADLRRQRKLKKDGWIAQARLDQAIAAEQEAASRVERAKRALDVIANQVSYTVLRADSDGLVTGVSAEAGEVIAAGQPALTIASTDTLEAVIAVPEQNVEDMKSAKTSAQLWESQKKSYAVALREVAGAADPQTRTFAFRYTILNPDAEIRLGKTITLRAVWQAEAELIHLPLSAVMNDAKGPMVWVVNAQGDGITRRAVTVKAFEQDRVAITAGLEPGERVVALGIHQLDEGREVRIVETAPQLAERVAP